MRTPWRWISWPRILMNQHNVRHADDTLARGGADRKSSRRDMLRAVFGLLSPAGAHGRLTILMFHRVREQRDELFPNEMHAAMFRERMLWMRSWFNVLPLEEAIPALSRGTLPARALAITFDDG